MTDLTFPKRHPENSNLSIWYEPCYQDWPLMVEKGPFLTEFLEDLCQTTHRALAYYPRVFAARIDLRFPEGYGIPDDFVHNTVMRRFVDSLEAQIKASQDKSRREGKRVHPTELFYFWVREVNYVGRPHYHFAFLLNEDAYFKLGNLVPAESNMFDRLQRAWASALRLDVSEVKGLVNVPKNAVFSLRRALGDPGAAAFTYRTSYFCKVATKVFMGRTRNRGCSRR
jgi:hypothetical protein